MSTLFEKFKNMEIEVKNVQQSKQTKTSVDAPENVCSFSFAAVFQPKQFYDLLQERKVVLINELFKDGYAPLKAIEQEFNFALEFLEQALQKLTTDSKMLLPVDLDFSCYSLFQLLIDISSSYYVTGLFTCTTLKCLMSFAKGLWPEIADIKMEKTKFKTPLYGTLVVTEAADIHSAVDEVTKAWKNLRQPWVIRKVLVQENVKDKFFTLLEQNLPKVDQIYAGDNNFMQVYDSTVKTLVMKGIQLIQPANNDIFKATVALGVPIAHVKNDNIPTIPIVVLDTFRTAKEGVTLANKEGNGEFVSVWSENITEAFEYVKCLNASTVWVNCHGILNPKCPFVVNGSKYFMKCEMEPTVLQHAQTKEGRLPFPDIPDESYQYSSFEGGYFFTVTSEKCKKCPALMIPSVASKEEYTWFEDGSRLFNYDYKTVVVRYGQTFAN